MKIHSINFARVLIYDNGGTEHGGTADRYTAIFLDQPERDGTFSALGMNAEPFHPQGIGQHCSAMPGEHLGKEIEFDDLPEDCQRAIENDTENCLAMFERFYFTMPADAVRECSGPGDAGDAVNYWKNKITRPDEITPEKLRAELGDQGAWDETELQDDGENWRRIVWIAAGNISENHFQDLRTAERAADLCAD